MHSLNHDQPNHEVEEETESLDQDVLGERSSWTKESEDGPNLDPRAECGGRV